MTAEERWTELRRVVAEHAELWAATRTVTPEGHTDDGCTAYRMALDWVQDQLDELEGR